MIRGLKYVFFFIVLVLCAGDIHAEQGGIIISSRNGEVLFPSYIYHISPLIKEFCPCAPEENKFIKIHMDYESNQLAVISELLHRLPETARNCNGKEVTANEISTKTIFVNQYVREKLLHLLNFEICRYYAEKKGDRSPRALNSGDMESPRKRYSIRIADSPATTDSSQINESPREGESQQPSSCRNSMKILRSGSKLHLDSFIKGLKGWIDPVSVTPTRSEFNKILGDLYRLSLELEIKPIANFLAYAIVDRLPIESVSLVGALQKHGYGSFVGEQLGYCKKQLALKELDAKELTVADYIGINGQPSCVKQAIDLSGKQLTGLNGIELLQNKKVRKLSLQRNRLLGSDLDPDFPKGLFGSFPGLRRLYLHNNKLTAVPKELLKGLNISTFRIDNNHFPVNIEKISTLISSEVEKLSRIDKAFCIKCLPDTVYLAFTLEDGKLDRKLVQDVCSVIKGVDPSIKNVNYLCDLVESAKLLESLAPMLGDMKKYSTPLFERIVCNGFKGVQFPLIDQSSNQKVRTFGCR